MYKHFLTSVLHVFFMLSCSKLSPFEGKMRECVQTSLSWRNDTTGIWETAGWWNSANVLTATIRYGAVTKDPAIPSVIEDVFEKARHYQVGVDNRLERRLRRRHFLEEESTALQELDCQQLILPYGDPFI